MACVSNALVIGGGIGGLAAALALSKIGVRCDVVELAEVPLGASLAFSGRAAEALDELGVYDDACRTGTVFGPESTATSLRNAQGDLLSAGMQRPTWPGCKDGVAVYRPVFLEIVAAAAEKMGVSIRKGLTAEKIENSEKTALVTFADGEQRCYDLVIGSDGIGSHTRNLLYPDAPKPAYAGQMSVRWMAPGPAIPDEGWYNCSLGRLGFYYLPQGYVYVPAVITVAEWKRMSREEVYTIFKGLLDAYTAPAIVELRRRLTPESQLIGRPFEWLLVADPWYRGRTILLGDAAHATTAHMGMGGGMAVEDAVVLAQCLAAASDLPDAFRTFMARRLPRVKLVVETSVALSRLEQAKAPPTETRALLGSALHALAEPY